MKLSELNRQQLELAYINKIALDNIIEAGSNSKGTYVKCIDGNLYMSAVSYGDWPCEYVSLDGGIYTKTGKWRDDSRAGI